MKIAGIVNDYNEALEIESIVKVFLIKRRIINLLSIEKNKNFEKANSNMMTFSKSDFKYSQASKGKILHVKNNEDPVPVFNVRGLV